MQTENSVQRHKIGGFDRNSGDLGLNDDAQKASLSEHLFEKVQESPMGRLLHLISSLPEVRVDKVERARKHIHKDEKELDRALDMALDRMLEDLLFE